MPAKRRGLLVILIALFFSGALSLDKIARTLGLDGPVTVSEQSKAHILHGDETGGGHQFGAGRPCKSEFPKEWSGDDIIANVELIASNDNLPWRKQKNGYYTAEETVEGVRVRVILNGRRNDVVTAYPVNTGRNPCPRRAPANDNFDYNE
jgi:hypothetical protein